MKKLLLPLILVLFILVPACSGGGMNPVTPPTDQNGTTENLQDDFSPVIASDVLYSRNSEGTEGYKAFGVYHVRIDPPTLTVEIIPSRKAEAIGHTFDSDLTQFLIKAPCYNCLQLDGIEFLGNSQVKIGFAVKHPFPTLTSRPDLHGFDVRGIVIAKGNYNFPNILIALSPTNLAPARANVSLVANADGYTHHFDGLAADTNYFNPPRNYDANINPFKRFFVNPTAGTFNPLSPTGYNVMPTGATWNTQDYIFNIPQGSEIDFAFVVDCAYGQSATFQNRNNPYYFLPEFNRKEAWKAEVSITSNNLQSGVASSTAQIQVAVCDWQAGKSVDPNYPNTSNLGGISEESDVQNVELLVPSLGNIIQSSTPASGNGSNASPYLFNMTITNTLAATAGTYYGIVAVRDDLHGSQGPMAIPASPSTFQGPEIVDYSVYQIFPIRVAGSPPTVSSLTPPPSTVYENNSFSVGGVVSEPDGDPITYLWQQMAPASPSGIFINPAARNTTFVTPDLYDIPEIGIQFTLRLTATDIDGSGFKEINFYVKEYNHPPVCLGIETVPYDGITDPETETVFIAYGSDPDDDILLYEWDFDYDFFTFDIEGIGEFTTNFFHTPGFYTVACRITEQERTNAIHTMCYKNIIVEGFYNDDIKIDDSTAADPDFHSPDIVFSDRIYHAVWISGVDYTIKYGNNSDNHDAFGDYFTITTKPTSGNLLPPKISGWLNNVLVVWVEYDTATPPFKYRLKVRTSSNSGRTWGNVITIVTKDSPDTLDDFAICPGNMPNQFFLFYEAKETAQIKNYLLITSDAGINWDTPSGGGQFRDVFGVGDYVEHLHVGIGLNNILYTFWLDGQVTPGRFLLDWSQDNGITWHTDIVENTTTDTFIDGDMDLDQLGNAYFVTLTDNSAYTIKKATFSTQPDITTITSIGSSAITSVNIWVSPTGQTILIPQTRNNATHIYYSPNAGILWGTYPSEISHSTGATYDVVIDGSVTQAPDGVEVLLGWVDNRGGSGDKAHIYGNFVYMAE